jgi:hypothetical protein
MDGVSNVMERLAELSRNIGPLEMLVRDEVKKMDDHTFWTSVCHAVIADSLDEAPEGTHLFQCAWGNREIFNDRNNPRHYLIAKDPGVPVRKTEPKPEIQVNIAQLARFAMTCPYEGTQRCPRRNFQFETQEDHQRESMLEHETERMKTPKGYRPSIEGATFTGETIIR